MPEPIVLFGIQFTLGLVAYLLIAFWYVTPRLDPLPRELALIPLLWVHAFRIVGGTILKVVLLAVMTPIELIGKLAKPFALAVRLFANMTSGHVLVLALIGLTFLFQSWAVGIGASILATGVMLLEVFVAFLQAFVFTLLTAVFIGLMRAEH